jgi:hypothetical protein
MAVKMKRVVGINIKVRVNQVQKERLFKGKENTYLDLTAFINLDEQDKYGENGTIVQSSTKEEREQQIDLPPIGGVKVFYLDERPEKSNTPKSSTDEVGKEGKDNYIDNDDDIPF